MSFAFQVVPKASAEVKGRAPAADPSRAEIEKGLALLADIGNADYDDLVASFASPYTEVAAQALRVATDCISYRPGVLTEGEMPKYSRAQRSAVITALAFNAHNLGQFPEELTQALCEASRYRDSDQRNIVGCLRGQKGAEEALTSILRDRNAGEDVRAEASASLVGINNVEVDRARSDLLSNPEYYNVPASLRKVVIHDALNPAAPELIDSLVNAAKPRHDFIDRLNALINLEGKVADSKNQAELGKIIRNGDQTHGQIQPPERPEIILAAMRAGAVVTNGQPNSEFMEAIYSIVSSSKNDKLVDAALEQLKSLALVNDPKYVSTLVSVLDKSTNQQHLSTALAGLRGSHLEDYQVGMYRFLCRCQDPELQVQALGDIRTIVSRDLPDGLSEVGTPMRNLRNIVIGLRHHTDSAQVMVGIRDTLALFKDPSLSDSLFEIACNSEYPRHIRVNSAEALALQHTRHSSEKCRELVFMDKSKLDGGSGELEHFDYRPPGRFRHGMVSATIGAVIQNAALHGLGSVTIPEQRLELLSRVRYGQFADGHMALKATGLASTEAEARLLAEILRPEGRGGPLGVVAYQVGQVYPTGTVQAAIGALSYTKFKPGVDAVIGVLKNSPSENHRFLAAGALDEKTFDGMMALAEARRHDDSTLVEKICRTKLYLAVPRGSTADQAA